MTEQEFNQLREGQRIRHQHAMPGHHFEVLRNYVGESIGMKNSEGFEHRITKAAALEYWEVVNLEREEDTMEKELGADCAPITIDLTPVGCKTPEGNARVNAAMEAFKNSHAEVANLAGRLLSHHGYEIRAILDEEGRDTFKELEEAIERRDAVQEEFLRAVAGVPART